MIKFKFQAPGNLAGPDLSFDVHLHIVTRQSHKCAIKKTNQQRKLEGNPARITDKKYTISLQKEKRILNFTKMVSKLHSSKVIVIIT